LNQKIKGTTHPGRIRTHGETPGNLQVSKTTGANSGAKATESLDLSPDLLELVTVWIQLPEAMKAGILAMVRSVRMSPPDSV